MQLPCMTSSLQNHGVIIIALSIANWNYIARPMPAALFAGWVADWSAPDTSHEFFNTDFAAIM